MVSIIIPTHKEANIKPLLDSLNRSKYKEFETIIINEGKERSIQRNIGINKANGEYLLILDSDQVISPNLIGECVNLMSNYDAVYIPEKIMTKGLFGALRNWERQFYTGTLIDVVRFVKAGCPYFNEKMSGPEDSDWDRRIIGKRTISKNLVYHYDNVGIIKYLKKKAYYTKSMREYQKLHPDDKVLDFKYRCWTVFTEKGKWKRLFHPFVIGLIILLFIRGIIYLTKR